MELTEEFLNKRLKQIVTKKQRSDEFATKKYLAKWQSSPKELKTVEEFKEEITSINKKLLRKGVNLSSLNVLESHKDTVSDYGQFHYPQEKNPLVKRRHELQKKIEDYREREIQFLGKELDKLLFEKTKVKLQELNRKRGSSGLNPQEQKSQYEAIGEMAGISQGSEECGLEAAWFLVTEQYKQRIDRTVNHFIKNYFGEDCLKTADAEQLRDNWADLIVYRLIKGDTPETVEKWKQVKGTSVDKHLELNYKRIRPLVERACAPFRKVEAILQNEPRSLKKYFKSKPELEIAKSFLRKDVIGKISNFVAESRLIKEASWNPEYKGEEGESLLTKLNILKHIKYLLKMDIDKVNKLKLAVNGSKLNAIIQKTIGNYNNLPIVGNLTHYLFGSRKKGARNSLGKLWDCLEDLKDIKDFSLFKQTISLDKTITVEKGSGGQEEVKETLGAQIPSGINIKEKIAYNLIKERLESKLTPDEKDIFRLLEKGYKKEEIARIRQLSPRTIRRRIKSIQEKHKGIM